MPRNRRIGRAMLYREERGEILTGRAACLCNLRYQENKGTANGLIRNRFSGSVLHLHATAPRTRLPIPAYRNAKNSRRNGHHEFLL